MFLARDFFKQRRNLRTLSNHPTLAKRPGSGGLSNDRNNKRSSLFQTKALRFPYRSRWSMTVVPPKPCGNFLKSALRQVQSFPDKHQLTSHHRLRKPCRQCSSFSNSHNRNLIFPLTKPSASYLPNSKIHNSFLTTRPLILLCSSNNSCNSSNTPSTLLFSSPRALMLTHTSFLLLRVLTSTCLSTQPRPPLQL